MSEFSLIEKYFSDIGQKRQDVLLSVGDDAAIVDVENLKQLAISVDTLIAGVHFPENTSAYDIGWKSLAVNLSDMAAMGAQPCWVTLAIALPKPEQRWLEQFSQGFSELAKKNNVQLIGGDTTRGTLSVTVQIIGHVESEQILKRSNAKVGDRIFVTGNLGDAGLALQSYLKNISLSESDHENVYARLNRPEPRVAFALAQKHLINAAIDISDGLYADLAHILKASSVGADIQFDQIPLSETYQKYLVDHKPYDLALAGGDDYELCVTVPECHVEEFRANAKLTDCKCTEIGSIVEGDKLSFWDKFGNNYTLQSQAYDHFPKDKR